MEEDQKHIELMPIEEGHKSHRDGKKGKGRRPGRGHGREGYMKLKETENVNEPENEEEKEESLNLISGTNKEKIVNRLLLRKS